MFCFGDVDKLSNPDTKVSVRVHDACLNSMYLEEPFVHVLHI